MADAPELRRSLWREAFGKPEFRSRRERVGHRTYVIVVGLLVVVPAACFGPFDSALYAICVGLGVIVLQWGGWLVWLFWGRKRFPLQTPTSSRRS